MSLALLYGKVLMFVLFRMRRPIRLRLEAKAKTLRPNWNTTAVSALTSCWSRRRSSRTSWRRSRPRARLSPKLGARRRQRSRLDLLLLPPLPQPSKSFSKLSRWLFLCMLKLISWVFLCQFYLAKITNGEPLFPGVPGSVLGWVTRISWK